MADIANKILLNIEITKYIIILTPSSSDCFTICGFTFIKHGPYSHHFLDFSLRSRYFLHRLVQAISDIIITNACPDYQYCPRYDLHIFILLQQPISHFIIQILWRLVISADASHHWAVLPSLDCFCLVFFFLVEISKMALENNSWIWEQTKLNICWYLCWSKI